MSAGKDHFLLCFCDGIVHVSLAVQQGLPNTRRMLALFSFQTVLLKDSSPTVLLSA